MNQIINWLMGFINQLLETKKKKVYSSFRDNIWGIDLADMQSLSKYNKGNKYFLCANDLISEGRKPNKMWVDQGSEFYDNSFKDFLKINNIEMY